MKARFTPFDFLRLAVLCLIGLSMALPFLWMVGASFKPYTEIDTSQLIPAQPTLENYPIVLNQADAPSLGKKLDLKFGRWYFNSLFTAFGITLLQVLTSAMAAYAFSRLRWRWRDRVFLLYLATMMIPGLVIMIPAFQIVVWMGLLNTYAGLILPMAFSTFGTFMLRQFMLGIPRSLDEAALIDGASHWRVFLDIILPLTRPGMIALAIVTFLGSYQSFFWPLIMLNDDQLYPMSVGMLAFDTIFGRQTELIMAASVMNIAPLILVFVIFQKFMVKGLQLGAVKG